MSRTTMTIKQLGLTLGLKKTALYRLLKSANFEDVRIGHSRRIYRDSFEDWYAHQLHYRKINGEPPGKALGENIITLIEISEKYNVPYEIIHTCARALNIEIIEAGFRKGIKESDLEPLLKLRKERSEKYGKHSDPRQKD